MNFSPGSLRGGSRKPPPPPSSSPSPRQQSDTSSPTTSAIEDSNVDIYATMIHKKDVVKGEDDEDDDEDEDEALPPLLKRLPKDFGLAGDEDEEFESSSSISGTMIVKSSDQGVKEVKTTSYRDRSRFRDGDDDEKRFRRRNFDDEDDEGGDFGTFVVKRGNFDEEEGGGEGGDFGTFVVKGGVFDKDGGGEEGDYGTFVVKRAGEVEKDVSGTVVRKTVRSRGSGGDGMSTMSRAVASMQGVGEGGFGRQRRSGASGKDERTGVLRQQGSGKVSSSSIPESVTREDPTTKYELLNELGKNELSLSCIPHIEVPFYAAW